MGKLRKKNISKMTDEEIKEAVKKKYARVAASSKGCCDSICCDFPFPGRGTALAEMPRSVTESFAGCGNPVAISDIKEGETVLDLGSGAGLDVFMAAKKVGERGKVIGIDMTPEMVEKARVNAEKLGVKNVEFRLGDIEDLPIEDESVDVVISNCVINLTPNKHKAFREAYRVLKPSGRMYISDIVVKSKLPRELLESIKAYTSCVSGALKEEEYMRAIMDAGFLSVEILGRTRLGPIASDKIIAYKPKT